MQVAVDQPALNMASKALVSGFVSRGGMKRFSQSQVVASWMWLNYLGTEFDWRSQAPLPMQPSYRTAQQAELSSFQAYYLDRYVLDLTVCCGSSLAASLFLRAPRRRFPSSGQGGASYLVASTADDLAHVYVARYSR